jgi:hypothetical protein
MFYRNRYIFVPEKNVVIKMLIQVGFEVLTATTKMAVFWDIALMMEAARTFETLVNFYQTTRR